MKKSQKKLLILLSVGMLLIWSSLAIVLLWPRPDTARLIPTLSPPLINHTATPSAFTAVPTLTAWPSPWTPTATPTITLTPTVTPTWTPTHTRTPVRIPVTPTNTPHPMAECECTGDLYDCDDFPSKALAQACYERCKAPGYGDIHHLDDDEDGKACQ